MSIKSDGGSIEWVPLDTIVILNAVQQRFYQQHADGIAVRFDLETFGVLTTARIKLPDHDTESIVLIDGLHRYWAARKVLGSAHSVPCVIHNLPTVEAALALRSQSMSKHFLRRKK